MRLTKKEISAIKKVFNQIFGMGKIFLFGSRVSKNKLGGDIDIYIVPEKKDDLFAKKLSFLVSLKKMIGDQKIDVIIAKNPDRAIEKEALENGVEL